MKKKFVIYILVAGILIFSIELSGCIEDSENKIIVGTSADYPPFEYVENGKIVGFDIELITSLLEALDYTVEVQDIGFDSLVPSLVTGKIDVIAAAMTITPSRFFSFELSATGILDHADFRQFVSFLRELPGIDLMNCSFPSRNNPMSIFVLPISTAIMFIVCGSICYPLSPLVYI